MIERTEIATELTARLGRNPAVDVLGPRQVGKTTLANKIAQGTNSKYFDLEQTNTLNLFKQDVELTLREAGDELWVLDEVQELPEIFRALRSNIDLNRKNGRFLLLGSAHPKLVRGVSESLAGRVSYLDLTPFHLSEVGIENQNKHWHRGGFPNAYLAEKNNGFSEWMEDYIRSYIEREINTLFNVNLDTVLIERLWRMLSHLNGSLLNVANLSRSLGITSNTVNQYINLLEGAFLVKRLHPWYINTKKRLVKSPKIYLADTGILHSLLNIKSMEDLKYHPGIGASWENYVFLQISNVIKRPYQLYFYRTHNGAEIDLLLVQGITPVAAIEIKNSNSPTPTRGFYTAIEDLETTHNYIITREDSFPPLGNRQVRSLVDFLTIDLPSLVS